jgi:hypothetical protein
MSRVKIERKQPIRRHIRIYTKVRLHSGRPLTAPDPLERGYGATYHMRMPVRLFRQILSVLLVVAYVSATIITVAPVAQAAPQEMSGSMTMAQDGAKDPMPCGKSMKPGCVAELGCVFMVSLPAVNSGIATVIGWSTVTYSVAAEFLPENSIKPALGPPRSRT